MIYSGKRRPSRRTDDVASKPLAHTPRAPRDRRYVPTADFEAKRALYPAPKVLHDWADVPLPGTYLEAEKLNSAELEFWGGDLRSAATKVGYIRSLGADVLYLNPIHLAYTNHKYDAFDYREISPEYGTHADFRALADGVHAAGMKLVMDGVFNHMGRNAPRFKEAFADPQSKWGDRDSVVRGWLRQGADGWRLDTAFELGPKKLRALTDAAHAEKPGSLIVGEIANYPGEWLQAMDAVMGFNLRHVLLGAINGQIEPARAP